MNEKNYLRSMLVLCGYGFGENGPFIEYDDWHDGGLRKQLALLDNTKYIRFYSSRYCPGSFNLAKLKGQPCNELTPIELPSFNSCKTCFDKTGFNPAFYHMNKSEISPQQRTYNNEAHKVYLAWFSQGLMKVGISNSRRIETRWLEQGARAAVQVEETRNAYEARDLELKFSEELNLPEVILGRKKRKLIHLEMDASMARMELDTYLSRLNMASTRYSEIQFLDNHYHLDIPENKPVVDQTEMGILSGRFVGLIGEHLLYYDETKSCTYVLSLKKWNGHTVEFGKEMKEVRSPEQQMSLF